MQHPKAYMWNLVGRFLPSGIHLVTNMVLARFLAPADFGMIGVLTVFFTVANVLMDIGLGGALIKEKETRALDCSTMFVFNLLASALIYVILFFSAGFVENFYNTEGLAALMRILCLIFVINAWGLVPRSLMIKQLRFKEITGVTSVASLCACIISIATAILGTKVYAIVLYQLVYAIMIVLGSYFYTRYRISFKFSGESFRRLFSFGIMTTITSVIDTIYENLMSILFGKYISVSQAGYLDQAKKIETVVTQTFTMTINSVSFPILSKLADNLKKFTSEADSIFRVVTRGLFPLLMILCVFSKDIITLLYGKAWVTSAPYFSLLIFAGLFQVMETLNRNFIKSFGEVRQLAMITIIKRAVGIGLIIVWLTFSVDTILYAYIISSFVGYAFNMSIYSKITSQSVCRQLLHALFALLPSAIMFIIFTAIYHINVNLLVRIVLVAATTLVYYLFILPLLGIDTRKYINKILVKNKNSDEE